ncbi:MAG: amino acid amidase [Candidatus Eisenbacteria bacterium]|nr:amino acid amidase [Candidatus Eisenbacteria bacterium]
MKVYISADIEGVTGTTHWDETDKKHGDFAAARDQMTAEVAAACQGALAAGAKEIWIKDAHHTGRNIDPAKLPEDVRLIRGWSGHPFSMIQELDESFQAMIMIGYHSRAGSGTSPLAHTLTGALNSITLNGAPASEFLLHAYGAALAGVPVVLVSGDEGLCQEIEGLNSSIATVSVMCGIGDSTVSIHPARAVRLIREGTQAALEADRSRCRLTLPGSFTIEINFKNHARAYRASFYPGMELADARTAIFTTGDFYEVLRMLAFAI